jgi:predicted phage replisome organizer
MADKKYYWLKLKRDFFKRHDIQIIESMPNGKDYVLFYLKLLVESVDHEGALRFNSTIPYNEEMLSTITRTNIDVVRAAMKLFTELQMIEVLDDGTIYMNEVTSLLGSEGWSTERVRRFREARKQLPQDIQECNASVTSCNTTETKSKRKSIEIDKDIDTDKELLFGQFWAAYPRKVAKQAALKAYTKLAPNEDLFNTMLTALARQIESEEWQRDNGRYIPYPATWLNGRRWEDEADEEQPSQKKHKLIERDGQLYAVEVDDDT